MNILDMMCSLKDGNEVEVFVNHLVDEPIMSPMLLENASHEDIGKSAATFKTMSNFRIGEDHLNIEDHVTSFPTTPPFNTTPLFTTTDSAVTSSIVAPSAAAPSAAAVDDIDDSVESEGELVGNNDQTEYGSDVHKEVRELKAEKRKFQRRKRNERVPTDNVEVPVGDAGSDLGLMKLKQEE
ncbi:hypothetical protein P3S68_007694 [Capsicum galapagoense]